MAAASSGLLDKTLKPLARTSTCYIEEMKFTTFTEGMKLSTVGTTTHESKSQRKRHGKRTENNRLYCNHNKGRQNCLVDTKCRAKRRKLRREMLENKTLAEEEREIPESAS